MRTTIFIPDDLGEQAYTLAKKDGLNRSQLHQHLLAKYVKEQEDSDFTAELNKVIAEVGQESSLMTAAGMRAIIDRGEWEW